MVKIKIGLVALLLNFLGGCIGTDYVDDPIVEERIEVSQDRIALKKEESTIITANYYDQYGLLRNAPIEWISSNSLIVSINAQGELKALATGQATVVAAVGNTKSKSVFVNVVLNEMQVASVDIISPGQKQTLEINETHQLQVITKNINGEILANKPIEWFSENSALASVANGLVTGKSQGVVDIHAKSEGVKSNVINFSVGGGRTGTFVSAGGYRTVGMATIKPNDGKLILELSNSFETSFALGTFVYLANSTNGSQVRSGGLEIAQITSNGAKTFNLTAIKPDIKISDYNYVIILCKPAGVTFGYALLN